MTNGAHLCAMSLLLFVFLQLWLNVQQKCPFTPKRVNTCVKEVRPRALSCTLAAVSWCAVGEASGAARLPASVRASAPFTTALYAVFHVRRHTHQPANHLPAVSKTCQEVTHIFFHRYTGRVRIERTAKRNPLMHTSILKIVVHVGDEVCHNGNQLNSALRFKASKFDCTSYSSFRIHFPSRRTN